MGGASIESRPRSLRDDALQRDLAEQGYCIVDVPLEVLDELSLLYGRIRPAELERFTASIQVEHGTYRADAHHGVRHVVAGLVGDLFVGHRVVAANYVVKQPGDWVVEPHQDFDFTDEQRHTAVLAWIPLADVGEAGGGLGVVPGSHLWPTFPRGSGAHVFPHAHRMEELRSSAVYLELSRGRAVLYDTRTFHCSGPNRSCTERVAAAFAVIPTDAPLLHHHVEPDGSVTVLAVDDDIYADTPFHGYPVRGTVIRSSPSSAAPRRGLQRWGRRRRV